MQQPLISRRLRPYVLILSSLALVPFIFLLGLEVAFLLSPDPVIYTMAKEGLWPIVCSSRGCITTRQWAQYENLATEYAAKAGQQQPSKKEILQTLIRHHLLEHAFFKAPVTVADAKRYREEVLNVHTSEAIEDVLGISAEQYDEAVILPFLKQEALRQQYQAESADELYTVLSHDRFIVSLLRHYPWDRELGKIQ